MQQDNLVTVLERVFLDRTDHSRENRIGDRGDDHAKKFGRVGAESARGGVRHVAHGFGNLADPGFGGSRNIFGIPQRLGDRHDGNAGTGGNVFEPDHDLSFGF
jgi:hypothetical protein